MVQVKDNFPKGLGLMSFSNVTDENTSSCALPKQIPSDDFCRGKVVLFAIPAAFTPTCQNKHIPGFLEHYDAIKAKGVDKIACIANDSHFVMFAFGRQLGCGDKILMLGDNNGILNDALPDLNQDLSSNSLGSKRLKRFAMIINEGVIEYIGIGGLDVSGAEAVLAKL